MGNLITSLKKDKAAGVDVFLDFENAQPTEAEEEMYGQVQKTLEQASTVLTELGDYKGANESIRAAISNPSDEGAQDAAWGAVNPLVQQLQAFFNYSSEIETVLPGLLTSLCAENPEESLEQKQALAKQFAQILDFVLKFDDLKMCNPAIQNDLSYYRRTLSRMKLKEENAAESMSVVKDEELNRMSLFYAYPTPMLKCLSDATSRFVSENKEIPLENTTDTLSTLATICRIMIENNASTKKLNEQNLSFCQRVMVGVIILYDHVHPVGAFSKKNQAIDMRASIKALKCCELPAESGLMNALKYTTKHLNDEDTPKQVKAMLE